MSTDLPQPPPVRRAAAPAPQLELTLTAHALFFLGAICGACLTTAGGIALILLTR